MLKLYNILYILNLFVNFISSSTCQRNGITINTTNYFFCTKDKAKLVHFFIQKGLYCFNKLNNLYTTLLLVGPDYNSQRWYKRLNYLNFADIRCLKLPTNLFSYKTCTVLKRYKLFNYSS